MGASIHTIGKDVFSLNAERTNCLGYATENVADRLFGPDSWLFVIYRYCEYMNRVAIEGYSGPATFFEEQPAACKPSCKSGMLFMAGSR